jgi:hypothetical protein
MMLRTVPGCGFRTSGFSSRRRLHGKIKYWFNAMLSYVDSYRTSTVKHSDSKVAWRFSTEIYLQYGFPRIVH